MLLLFRVRLGFGQPPCSNDVAVQLESVEDHFFIQLVGLATPELKHTGRRQGTVGAQRADIQRPVTVGQGPVREVPRGEAALGARIDLFIEPHRVVDGPLGNVTVFDVQVFIFLPFAYTWRILTQTVRPAQWLPHLETVHTGVPPRLCFQRYEGNM